MTYRLDGVVIPTGFDVPVEPLRRAAHFTGEPGCIADGASRSLRRPRPLRAERPVRGSAHDGCAWR
ncbi:hypothetical protein STENM223S_01043 [Streptomyces tendae]